MLAHVLPGRRLSAHSSFLLVFVAKATTVSLPSQAPKVTYAVNSATYATPCQPRRRLSSLPQVNPVSGVRAVYGSSLRCGTAAFIHSLPVDKSLG